MNSLVRSRLAFTSQFLAVFIICFAAGKLSIQIRTISGLSSLIWLPGGVALAALTLHSLKLWPAVFLAALAVGTRNQYSFCVTFFVAVGSTVSSTLGAFFLREYSRPSRTTFARVREALAMIILVIVLSSGLGSAIEVGGLFIGRAIPLEKVFSTWRSWWLSEALSDLYLGGIIISYWNDIRHRIGRQLKLSWEFLFLTILVTVISVYNYSGLISGDPPLFMRPYLLFAVIIWSTLRFDMSGAMLVNLIVGFGLMYGRFHGFTPQSPVTSSVDQAAIQQIFALTLGAVGFVLGASIREKYEALKERTEFLKIAESANQAKDNFLATLSHELRTPLTTILGWTQELQTKNLNPELSEGLASIERNVKAQGRLIEDLLDVSKIQSNKISLEFRSVNLGVLLENSLASARVLADKKSQRIQLRFETLSCYVRADSIRLQQIFWNLLTNAIKFSPKGADILVGVDLLGSDKERIVQISFRDQGIGIKQEQLTHIFERFHQADSSTTRIYGGMGLGLSIVKSLVEMHSGKIEVTSQGESFGSTFTVTLPVMNSQEQKPHASDVSFNKNKRLGKMSGMRILVVDDSDDNLRLFSVMLTSLGAQVRIADSVKEALRSIEDFKPDILLSDISMPGEDGFSLIQKIRSGVVDKFASIPAIALTAYAGDEDVRKVLAAGFSAHVAKPVEKIILSQVIEAIAENHELSTGPRMASDLGHFHSTHFGSGGKDLEP